MLRLQDQTFVDALIRALHCGSFIMPDATEGPVNPEEAPLCHFKGKPYIMGHTAEFVAQHLDISREEMDRVALRSNNEAERATLDGSFAEEIVGSTGARLIVTLVHALKNQNKSLGLATLCGGGGVSMACAIEMI